MFLTTLKKVCASALIGPKMEISSKPDRKKKHTTMSSRCHSMCCEHVYQNMSTNVSSHCKISDAKSHKGPAVWASLEKILGSFDLDRLQVLYIITDSLTSQ